MKRARPVYPQPDTRDALEELAGGSDQLTNHFAVEGAVVHDRANMKLTAAEWNRRAALAAPPPCAARRGRHDTCRPH